MQSRQMVGGGICVSRISITFNDHSASCDFHEHKHEGNHRQVDQTLLERRYTLVYEQAGTADPGERRKAAEGAIAPRTLRHQGPVALQKSEEQIVHTSRSHRRSKPESRSGKRVNLSGSKTDGVRAAGASRSVCHGTYCCAWGWNHWDYNRP